MARKKQSHGWESVHSHVNTGNGLFVPLLPYMEAGSVKKIRYTFEIRACTDASAVFTPGYQTANSPASPDGPALVRSAASQTGDGLSDPTGMAAVDSVMAGKQLVRLGIWMKTSAATLHAAKIIGKWEIED